MLDEDGQMLKTNRNLLRLKFLKSNFKRELETVQIRTATGLLG